MTEACASAVRQPRTTAPVVTRPRTQLRLVPTPAPRPARRHDIAYVTCLALFLVGGVLAVLLLNTAVQQQADRISGQQRVVDRLVVEAQSMHVGLERDADPRALAARARMLGMRPVTRIRFVDVTPHSSGRTR